MPGKKSARKSKGSARRAEDVLDVHAPVGGIDDETPMETGADAGGSARASPPDAAPARHVRMENLDDSGLGLPSARQATSEFEPEVWVFQRGRDAPPGDVYKQAEVEQLEMTTSGTLRKGEAFAGVPTQWRSGSRPEIGDAWEGAGARRGQTIIHQADVTRSLARKATRVVKGLPPRKRAPAQARRERKAAAESAAVAAANPPPEKRMKKGGGRATATATAEDPAARRKPPQGASSSKPAARQPPPPPQNAPPTRQGTPQPSRDNILRQGSVGRKSTTSSTPQHVVKSQPSKQPVKSLFGKQEQHRLLSQARDGYAQGAPPATTAPPHQLQQRRLQESARTQSLPERGAVTAGRRSSAPKPDRQGKTTTTKTTHNKTSDNARRNDDPRQDKARRQNVSRFGNEHVFYQSDPTTYPEAAALRTDKRTEKVQAVVREQRDEYTASMVAKEALARERMFGKPKTTKTNTTTKTTTPITKTTPTSTKTTPKGKSSCSTDFVLPARRHGEKGSDYDKRCRAARSEALRISHPIESSAGENFNSFSESIPLRSPRGDTDDRRASWNSQEERLTPAASSTRRESPPDPAIAALQPPVEDEAPPYEDSEEEEEEVEREEEKDSLPLDEESDDSTIGWLAQVGPFSDCEDTREDHPMRPTSDEEEEEEEERVTKAATPENPDDDDSYLDDQSQEEEEEAGPQHASSTSTRRVFVKSKLPLRLRRKQAVDRRADFPPQRGKKVSIAPNDARITAAKRFSKTREEQRAHRWEQYDLRRGGGRGGGGGGGSKKSGQSNRNR